MLDGGGTLEFSEVMREEESGQNDRLQCNPKSSRLRFSAYQGCRWQRSNANWMDSVV